MKLRKHKNNKRFVVSYNTTSRELGVRKIIGGEYTNVAESKGAFLRGFYFGIDQYNTRIFSIAESPL